MSAALSTARPMVAAPRVAAPAPASRAVVCMSKSKVLQAEVRRRFP